MSKISVIIPTYNEATNIDRLLLHLMPYSDMGVEIILVDGESEDETVRLARKFDIKVLERERSRAKQMNAGAAVAQADILYFVHADTLPPDTFPEDILEAVEQGHDLGSYRFRFDSPKPALKINSYFTRFNRSWARGGDQTLFIKRDAFFQLHGFNEKYVIMEEYDLMRRAQQHGKVFKLLPKDVLVSARKYDSNSYFRVQVANLVAFNMFRWGYEPQRILSTYRKLIKYRS